MGVGVSLVHKRDAVQCRPRTDKHFLCPSGGPFGRMALYGEDTVSFLIQKKPTLPILGGDNCLDRRARTPLQFPAFTETDTCRRACPSPREAGMSMGGVALPPVPPQPGWDGPRPSSATATQRDAVRRGALRLCRQPPTRPPAVCPPRVAAKSVGAAKSLVRLLWALLSRAKRNGNSQTVSEGPSPNGSPSQMRRGSGCPVRQGHTRNCPTRQSFRPPPFTNPAPSISLICVILTVLGFRASVRMGLTRSKNFLGIIQETILFRTTQTSPIFLVCTFFAFPDLQPTLRTKCSKKQGIIT